MITQHIKIDGAEFRTWLSNMEFTAGDVRAYRFLFTFRGMETSGHRLIVKAKRADGEVVTGQAVDMAEGGAQEYILPNAMYAVPGTVEFEVGLYDGSGGCATSQVIAGTVRDGFGDGRPCATADTAGSGSFRGGRAGTFGGKRGGGPYDRPGGPCRPACGKSG